jgi:mono/diheme cytochrome c family protein
MHHRSATALLGAQLLFAACARPEAPPPTPPPAAPSAPAAPANTAATAPAASSETIKQGEYIAAVTGCVLCHTPMGPQGPAMQKAWAGGLEIKEAFGTWRSPNISQDRATGIGSWTDAQIIAAIREGRRPDGEQLYPVMPYLFYNKMSDADATALVAYLRTLPAVPQAVTRATDLRLPKIPAPPASGAAPAADPVHRGEYLALLMHCAACHTPLDKKSGAPDMSRAFAGGFPMELPPALGTGVLYSPNITPDQKTGIGSWTEAQLIAAVTQMKKPDGSLIRPPMALYQTGWFQLRDEDSKALAAYLKQLPAIANKVPASTFQAKTAMATPPGH